MKKNQSIREGMNVLSLGKMKKVLCLSAVALLLFASCSKEELPQAASPQADPKASRGISPASTAAGAWFDHGYFVAHYVRGGFGAITFPYANQWPGNFELSWSNTQDIVSGKGWLPGSARIVNYNVGNLSGDYNFVGVYGWTKNPLIEYYVVEMGQNNANGIYVNTINSDGHNYNFYKHLQVNQPAPELASATFWQYLDNWGGATVGTSRSINMANHVNNWRARGGQGFGNFYFLVFGCESWTGRGGKINATVW
jgi:endo-1,4-beta-xylanase